MLNRVFVAFIVIIAVAVGLLNVTPFHSDVVRLAMFSEFFSASLPILAFGALVRYLCTCCCGKAGCNSSNCSK